MRFTVLCALPLLALGTAKASEPPSPIVQACLAHFQEQAAQSMDWHAKALELNTELAAARAELEKLKKPATPAVP